MADTPPRFRAAAAGSLCIETLDMLTVVYHRASGLTHVVDSPVPEILEILRTPMDAAALLAKLSEDFDLIDADIAALAARLDELVQVGLVERL